MLVIYKSLTLWILLICSLQYVLSYTSLAKADRLLSLPNAEPFRSKHFSGFLNVSSTRNMFYYYIESENDVDSDPVIFWTNGGPGCSGMIGMFTEMGPFRPTKDGHLVNNLFSWTKRASMVFIEQPIGVGFSYSTSSFESKFAGDLYAGRDNVIAIHEFFRKFPERFENGFIVSSESYGGHYIPELTLNIFDDSVLRPMFLGYLLGNPYVRWSSLNIGLANAGWGLQLFPAPKWREFTNAGCDDLSLNAFEFSDTCDKLIGDLWSHIDGLLNPYALNFPTCTSKNTYNAEAKKIPLGVSPQAYQLISTHAKATARIFSQRSRKGQNMNGMSLDSNLLAKKMASLSVYTTVVSTYKAKNRHFKLKDDYDYDNILNFPGNASYDPCRDQYATDYLNDLNVQLALRVIPSTQTTSKVWSSCDDNVNGDWFAMDVLSDVTDLYSLIYNHPNKPTGFKMLVYSGDSDGICATIGTQHWVYNVTNAEIMSLWKPYFLNGQQAGFITQFNDSFSFATVHYAGHEVPAYEPEKALHLLELYLNGDVFTPTTQAVTSSKSESQTSDSSSAMIAVGVFSSVVLVFVIIARAVQFSEKGKNRSLLKASSRQTSQYVKS